MPAHPLTFSAVVAGLVAMLACGVSTTRAAAATPQSGCAVHDGAVVHGSRRGRDIALTFDACPTSHVPGFSAAIVAYLAREQVPATFFVSGRWAESHPQDLARLESQSFFEIALHGYRHHRLNGAPSAAILGEIEDGQRALLRLGAHPSALFRPPFGDQPRVLAATAHAAGVTPVLWDVAPGDPNPKETAADIERDVLRRVQGGSIIVLHVNGRGVGTADALPALVQRLRTRGFRFVTVGDLLQECARATVQPAADGAARP
jgi:peptidoglycan/xylan/chitin deacetylase (PgdA/CDA1 family)